MLFWSPTSLIDKQLKRNVLTAKKLHAHSSFWLYIVSIIVRIYFSATRNSTKYKDRVAITSHCIMFCVLSLQLQTSQWQFDFPRPILQSTLSAFPKPGNSLSFCKISQSTDKNNISFFPSNSLILLHQHPQAAATKKTNFTMILLLHFAVETTNLWQRYCQIS